MITRRLLCAVCAVGLLATGAASASAAAPTAPKASPKERQQRAQSVVQRALSLAARGLHDLALDAYKQAIEIYPAYPLAHNELGALYVRKKQLDLALAHFEKACALDPEFAEAWANLAEMKRRQGRHEESAEHYAKALKLKPDDTDALFGAAVAYTALKDEKAALWAMERFLDLTKDYKGERTLAIQKRAGKLIAAGVVAKDPLAPEEQPETAEPIEEVEVALADDEGPEPGPLTPHQPGDSLFAKRRLVEAKAAYVQALKQEGAQQDVELLYKLGAVEAVMGNYRGCVRWWRVALSFAPGRKLIARHLGLAQIQMAKKGQLKLRPEQPENPGVEAARKALVDGNAALALARLHGLTDKEAIYLRGEAYLRMGQLEPAHKEFQQLVAADKNDRVALGGLAEALLRMGKTDDASAALDAWLGDQLAMPEDFVVLRADEAVARIQAGPPAAGGGGDEGDDEFDDF